MIRAPILALTLIATPAFGFDGPFDAYDPAQLQRGLQVYTEVCSACHGLRHVAIRTLGDTDGPALPADQVRAYADMISLTPPDRFPTSALPEAPDLSLAAKTHEDGPQHIADLLTAYDGTEVEGLYGNRVTGPIAMPPPLIGGMVTYRDGTEASEVQMATDVAAFLMWTAEPHATARKRTGFVAVGFLTVLAGLLWLTNREIWRRQPR